MSWREVMQAGAMGVVDSGIELMGQGRRRGVARSVGTRPGTGSSRSVQK